MTERKPKRNTTFLSLSAPIPLFVSPTLFGILACSATITCFNDKRVRIKSVTLSVAIWPNTARIYVMVGCFSHGLIFGKTLNHNKSIRAQPCWFFRLCMCVCVALRVLSNENIFWQNYERNCFVVSGMKLWNESTATTLPIRLSLLNDNINIIYRSTYVATPAKLISSILSRSF